MATRPAFDYILCPKALDQKLEVINIRQQYQGNKYRHQNRRQGSWAMVRDALS